MTITKHALAYSENSPVGRYPWLPRPVRTRGKVAVDAFRWWRSPRRQLLLRMPRGAVAAEIGAWTGDFSQRIRQYTSPLIRPDQRELLQSRQFPCADRCPAVALEGSWPV